MRQFIRFFQGLSEAHQQRFLALLQAAISSPSITVRQKQLLEYRYYLLTHL